MNTVKPYSVVLMILIVASIMTPIATMQGPAKQDVSILSWMSGTWVEVIGQTEMEEQWTTPKGGSLLGVHRDVRAGRTISFEFMRIQQDADGITFWGSPGGKPAVPFRAIEVTSQRVTFENKEHDFPQRVIYWLTADEMLHAKIEGTMNGKLESEEWAWKKQ